MGEQPPGKIQPATIWSTQQSQSPPVSTPQAPQAPTQQQPPAAPSQPEGRAPENPANPSANPRAQGAAMTPKTSPAQRPPQNQAAPAQPQPPQAVNPQHAAQPAQSTGQMNEVAKSVDDMAMLQANVPAELVQKYKENLASGKTNKTPQEAMAYYQAYYQAPAVAQGAAQGLRARGDAQLAAAQEYATGVDQLKDVGVKNYGDYNYKTDIQNKRIAEDNASLEAELKRQEAGGGLKYRQASTGFGTPEQVSQDAASINALYGAEKSKKEAYNAEQDKVMADWKQTKAAKDEFQRESMGIDPDKARKDINRLSGQFAAITKQGVAPGYKFIDFVQDEIRNNKVDPGAIKIIEENYSHTFDKTPSQQSGQSAPAQSALDLARQKAADTRDARGTKEAQQRGLERRREQAAAQGAYRERAAALMGQGLSPQQAHQALARDQATQDFYNANIKVAQGQGQGGAAMADLYKTQMQFMDSQLDRKDRSEQRAYDQDKTKRAQVAGLFQQAASMFPGQNLYDPSSQAGRWIEDQQRIMDGLQPRNRIQEAKDSQSRTPEQIKDVADSVVGKLTQDNTFDPKDPSSINSVVSGVGNSGLSPDEQADAVSQIIGADIKKPMIAMEKISDIFKNAPKTKEESEAFVREYSGALKMLMTHADKKAFMQFYIDLPQHLKYEIKNQLGYEFNPPDPAINYGGGDYMH